MRCFYKVHAQSGENSELTFFIHKENESPNKLENVLADDSEKSEIQPLTVDEVKRDSVYRKFESQAKPKLVMVDYHIYQTENDFTKLPPVTLDEHFQMLIDENQAELMTSGELSIEYAKRGKTVKPTGSKRKRKTSPLVFVFSGAAVLLAFLIGMGLGGGKGVIKLPSFDKTDFFHHVPGYTWGFSMNPKADRIRYG
jgi:hypothetical protein